jgi:GTPase SAR1 family protein
VLPEKVVLWVSYEDYDGNLTYIKNLLKIFESSCLEIKKTKDIFSYKKLIPALNSFPDYYILTADDDIYYRKDWVKKIWDEHEKNPDNIICYVAHKILLKGNNVLPYKQWESNIRDEKAGFFIFGCGCGGGLYHKKYLYKDVVNEKLFLKLAPTADDIWFYFMVIMNNRKYKVVKGPHNRLKYTDIYKEYGLNDKQILASQNVDQGKNDIQFSTIMEYYDLDFCKLISTGHF